MDFIFNSNGYDITHIIEQYEGKKLEDLFPNHNIIKNEMGEFMEIIWEEDEIPIDLHLPSTKKNLLRNLKTIYDIGENTEGRLIKKGVKSIYDLEAHLKYQKTASSVINLIENKDYKMLSENKNIKDIDLAFCFKDEDLLFLDIETLGIYDSPMIIVGVGYFLNKKFEIHLLFARDINEEIAICEHLRNEVFPNFKCFITYNGKTFDIPYMANRFLYYFDKNPMISKKDPPYENSNTKFHHIDLYHNCRREFKGKFSSYTLSNIETEVLSWKRDNDLPGRLVGYCYKKYKKKPERYTGLIKQCIDHNYYDVYSMPLILKELLNINNNVQDTEQIRRYFRNLQFYYREIQSNKRVNLE
jgi:uncharacterized protein YprB with RNaseH-like and TPR domain